MRLVRVIREGNNQEASIHKDYFIQSHFSAYAPSLEDRRIYRQLNLPQETRAGYCLLSWKTATVVQNDWCRHRWCIYGRQDSVQPLLPCKSCLVKFPENSWMFSWLNSFCPKVTGISEPCQYGKYWNIWEFTRLYWILLLSILISCSRHSGNSLFISCKVYSNNQWLTVLSILDDKCYWG